MGVPTAIPVAIVPHTVANNRKPIEPRYYNHESAATGSYKGSKMVRSKKARKGFHAGPSTYKGFFRDLARVLIRLQKGPTRALRLLGSTRVIVVKIMVFLWVPIIIRHLLFRVPKKGP